MTCVVKIDRAVAAILLATALGAVAGCSEVTGQQAVPGSSKAAKLTQCVRPEAFMRRNHFELIKHQRDITVHEGVRATKNSLAACIACHVQYDKKGQPVPVNAEGQFCEGCHDWLAVEPDCFGCHSTVPEGPQPSNLNKQWPSVFPAPVVKTKLAKPVVKPKPVTTAKPPVKPAQPAAKPATLKSAQPPVPVTEVPAQPAAKPATLESAQPPAPASEVPAQPAAKPATLESAQPPAPALEVPAQPVAKPAALESAQPVPTTTPSASTTPQTPSSGGN